jgi:hypothetical protein
LLRFAGGANVGAKAFALPLRCVLVPVVIESGLANGDDARMTSQLDQLVDRRFAYAGGLGMDANRSQNRRPGFGEREHPTEIFERDADAHRARRPRCPSSSRGLGRFFPTDPESRSAVDQHRRSSAGVLL